MKTRWIRLVAEISLVFASATLAKADVINGGFENDLFGWNWAITPVGFVEMPLIWQSREGFLPVEGQKFVELIAGRGSTMTLSQTFGLSAGENLSGFAAAFTGFQGMGSAMTAQVSISSPNLPSTTLWHAHLVVDPDVGIHAETPWTQWSFVAPSLDQYTLKLFLSSGHAGGHALFDAIGVGVPDGGPTLTLLALTAVAIGCLHLGRSGTRS